LTNLLFYLKEYLGNEQIRTRSNVSISKFLISHAI